MNVTEYNAQVNKQVSDEVSEDLKEESISVLEEDDSQKIRARKIQITPK